MRKALLLVTLVMVLVFVASCNKKTTEPVDTLVCSTPIFAPTAGAYSSGQNVSIYCATSGASIRYTLDGSDPTILSTQYLSQILISATTTIKAKAFKTDLGDSAIASALYTIQITPAEMVLVPAGIFTMGDTRGMGTSDEQPAHMVAINSFYMGKYEVTQGEYQAIMGSNPAWGYGVGTNYPVYNISWYSAIKYCNLRSMNEGLASVYIISGSTNPATWGTEPTSSNTAWNAAICNWSANGYRLPTEAEWEYAARGGTNTPDYLYSGSDDINTVAWYHTNSLYTSHIVGTKIPNTLGLYDMSGNEWEWCWDWYNAYSGSPDNNPTGASSGSLRVLRGGNWPYSANFCRVSYRVGSSPTGSFSYRGFRLCRTTY